MNAFDPTQLRPWRQPLWRLLVEVAGARCKGGPNEAKERDCAVALGLAPLEPRHAPMPDEIREAQAAGAERLRQAVEEHAGGRMATLLVAENVYRCSDAFAERCPARERYDCPRRRGHAPELGQRQMWDEGDAP